MNRPPIKEHTKAPDKLRLVAGRLVCKDGDDAQEYLLERMRVLKLADDIPVCVVPRDVLQSMYDELIVQRDMILCA